MLGLAGRLTSLQRDAAQARIAETAAIVAAGKVGVAEEVEGARRLGRDDRRPAAGKQVGHLVGGEEAGGGLAAGRLVGGNALARAAAEGAVRPADIEAARVQRLLDLRALRLGQALLGGFGLARLRLPRRLAPLPRHLLRGDAEHAANQVVRIEGERRARRRERGEHCKTDGERTKPRHAKPRAVANPRRS